MEDVITLDGVEYKKVEPKFPKTFDGDYYKFEVTGKKELRIYIKGVTEHIAWLIDSIPALRKALNHMEQ